MIRKNARVGCRRVTSRPSGLKLRFPLQPFGLGLVRNPRISRASKPISIVKRRCCTFHKCRHANEKFDHRHHVSDENLAIIRGVFGDPSIQPGPMCEASYAQYRSNARKAAASPCATDHVLVPCVEESTSPMRIRLHQQPTLRRLVHPVPVIQATEVLLYQATLCKKCIGFFPDELFSLYTRSKSQIQQTTWRGTPTIIVSEPTKIPNVPDAVQTFIALFFLRSHPPGHLYQALFGVHQRTADDWAEAEARRSSLAGARRVGNPALRVEHGVASSSPRCGERNRRHRVACLTLDQASHPEGHVLGQVR